MDVNLDDPLISGEIIWRALMFIGMIVLGVLVLRFRRAEANGRRWRALLVRSHIRRATVTDDDWHAAYEAGWRYLELGGWAGIAGGFLALAPVRIEAVTAWVLLGAALVAFMVFIGLLQSLMAARTARYPG